MTKQEATQKVNQDYKDKQDTQQLAKSFGPYMDTVKQDIDNNSLSLDNDIAKLENFVMNENAAMAYYVFNKIQKYVVKKYPESSTISSNVADSLDEMFLWQLTAIPKKTYDNNLPSRYVDLCLEIFPKYNAFFDAFGIKTDFPDQDKASTLNYDDKRSVIKNFLQVTKTNHKRIVTVLDRNANE